MLTRIRNTLASNIDYGGAVSGAVLLGSIVFWLNRAHGTSPAATAALKQATYTFFVAGFIVKNNERLALKRADARASVVLAATVSSCLAVGLTFLVHSAKGTPEPILSTLPTALMGPPGFLLLAWRARRRGIGSISHSH
jgi:hypothetical protein